MAKGIGNGFPLAAVVTTKEVAQSLTKAIHFNTFGGNPVACTVGSAVLDVIEEENLQQNCANVGTYFLKRLEELRTKYEVIGDVRGKGLMIGVEFVENKETKEPLNTARMNDIFEATKNGGILLGRGGLHKTVLRIQPPMIITKANVDQAIDVLDKACAQN